MGFPLLMPATTSIVIHRSDGLLAPAEVVERGRPARVDVLALTDHDEVSGLAEAREAARRPASSSSGGGASDPSVGTTSRSCRGSAHRSGECDAQRGPGRDPADWRTSRAPRIGDALAAAGIPGVRRPLKYVTSEAARLAHSTSRAFSSSGATRGRQGRLQALSLPGSPDTSAQHGRRERGVEWITSPAGRR